MRRLRSAVLAAGVLVALAGAGGCGTGGDTGDHGYFGNVKAPDGQVLTFNNGTEPETLDPNLMSGQPDGRIARMLFEGLTISNPRTLAPEPGQAERWEISADSRTYTFHLRRGLQWSDGRPVTAGDFHYSWLRAMSPTLGSRTSGMLTPIVNADRYNSGELTDSMQVGIEAPDDSTFIVHLNEPTPYFLYLTSFYNTLPVPRWVVEKWGNAWTQRDHIVGNGAFVMSEWRQNDQIVTVRNPRYWDAANVRLDKVIAFAVEDLSTSVNLYKAGTIDWCPSGYVPTQYVPYIRDRTDFRSGLYQGTYFYSINTTVKPFDNVYVRRALNKALDRESICTHLLRGIYPEYGLFVPQGYPGYVSPTPLRYDPVQARADLARAGFPGGKGFPPLSLLFNTSENHRRIAEAVQGMWKKELGIDVRLSNQEWGSYLQATTALQYQVARRSWIGDYMDPTTFLNIMKTGDGNNRTGWSSKQYDAWLAEAAIEPDVAKRSALLTRAEELVLRDGPLIPVYHYTTTEFVKPYVRGLYPTPLDFHPLKGVWIDHDWRTHPGEDAAAAAGGTR